MPLYFSEGSRYVPWLRELGGIHIDAEAGNARRFFSLW
jgi:hypothetical protein